MIALGFSLKRVPVTRKIELHIQGEQKSREI
jgi:hypothetical protein